MLVCCWEKEKGERRKRERERMLLEKGERRKRERRKKKERERVVGDGCDNALVKGPIVSANLRTCHWVTGFEWWKQLNCVFIFGFHHSVFWVIGWPKPSDQIWVMVSKQKIFCGSHKFWMMSDENTIISLKTLSSKQPLNFADALMDHYKKLYANLTKVTPF